MTTEITVVKLITKWQWKTVNNSLTSTRIYIEASVLPKGLIEYLPRVGDSWSDEFPDVKLLDIQTGYIADNPNCPRTYECNYGMILRPDGAGDWFDYPMSAEATSEFLTWDDPNKKNTTYEWSDDHTPVQQTMFKLQVSTSIKVTRLIEAQYLDTFIEESGQLSGLINENTFLNCPPQTVLYGSFNTSEPFLDEFGRQLRTLELVFNVRRVTNTDDDGWNYQLRESDGVWAKPLKGTEGLYKTTNNFDQLKNFQPVMFSTIPRVWPAS